MLLSLFKVGHCWCFLVTWCPGLWCGPLNTIYKLYIVQCMVNERCWTYIDTQLLVGMELKLEAKQLILLNTYFEVESNVEQIPTYLKEMTENEYAGTFCIQFTISHLWQVDQKTIVLAGRPECSTNIKVISRYVFITLSPSSYFLRSFPHHLDRVALLD